MPSKCTRCGKIHPDNAPYLLSGCNECGSKFFFYFRKDILPSVERNMSKLSKQEINEIEQDIRDIIPKGLEEKETVVLDLEAIRVIKPGKYKIDVTNLFNQKPIVIRLGPGKYKLDLTTLMTRLRRTPEEK